MPPHASSVSQARALLREALADAAESIVDCAQLAVSEVVTNALVHAGTEVHVQVRVDENGVRVEVSDGSTQLPTARDYSPASGTGRGLHMVMSTVDAWGCYPRSGGKVVWFEIHETPDPEDAGTRSPTPVQPTDSDADAAARVVAEAENVVAVELLNLPLLMHLAWQEHAAALLREFLLVALDGDEQAAFERHAAASEAMSVLHDQVPQPPLLEDPEAIMTTAMEPGVTADRLVVRVPRAVVADFHTLDLMLDEASALATSGALLVPPTQPEMAAMRRWVCTQVQQQDRAVSGPTPWSSTLVREDAPLERAAWEPAAVTRSPRALLAMDEAGTIVAVSGSAAQLLGYPSTAELRGRRLLRIVPQRYHQAHVAGTTLHMINGRDPLLGRRVTVPVLRADGEEIALDLQVQPRQLLEGRHVFIAEFFGP
jgi:PAS domain S-box-containing protein